MICVMYITLFNTHSNLLIIPIYRRRDRSSKRESNFPKIIQLKSVKEDSEGS